MKHAIVMEPTLVRRHDDGGESSEIEPFRHGLTRLEGLPGQKEVRVASPTEEVQIYDQVSDQGEVGGIRAAKGSSRVTPHHGPSSAAGAVGVVDGGIGG